MITFPTTIFVSTRATDMRKSIDGLCDEVHSYLGASSTSESLFVFFNYSRDKIKLLFWDNDGYVVFYRRLEHGTFQMPTFVNGSTHLSLDANALHCILAGIDLSSIKMRNRFKSIYKCVDN